MSAYDAALDSARCYDLAIAVAREKCVRAGSIQPATDRPWEARWAKEGRRPVQELDTVRGPQPKQQPLFAGARRMKNRVEQIGECTLVLGDCRSWRVAIDG